MENPGMAAAPGELALAVLDSMRDAVMVVDRERRIIYGNRAARELAGAELQEIVHQLCYERFWGRPAPCDHCPADAVFAGEQPGHCHATRPGADGAERHLEVWAFPLQDDSDPARYIVEIVRDVTEQRHREEQALRDEVLASVGEVAAVVAHEIRNPLGAMITALDLMELVEGQPATTDDVALHGVLRREAMRLKTIVSDFLQFARPSPPEPEPLALEVVVDDVIGSLARAAPAPADLVIRREPAGELPRVLADPSKLRQVLWNIGHNALQAMPKGGRLTFVARASTDGVELDITDTGEGVPAERLARIFEPFHTTREFGTGLGLTIARRLLEAQNGRLAVRSEVGVGTTFTLSLPAARGLGSD